MTWSSFCENCNRQISSPTQKHFVDYFEGAPWSCEWCNHEENLWQKYLHNLVPDQHWSSAVVALGFGGNTSIVTKMDRELPLTLDIHEHGVPNDAVVLSMNITPWATSSKATQKTSPVIVPALAIQQLQTRHLPRELGMHPVPPAPLRMDDCVDTTVGVHVVWGQAPAEPEEEALFTAAKAFTNGDYRGAVIPTQVAMELKLIQVLTKHYEIFGGKNAVGNFLRDGASYGHQLRFLMPSLFKLAGIPDLPPEVKSALADLRSKRDKVGHENAPADRSSVARMLLGGFFGYRYLATYGHLIARD